MIAKKLIRVITAALFVLAMNATFVFAESAVTEDLLFMDVPMVITASKIAESINVAPAVVYVISAKEIALSGARTLAEILKRVPGMRISIRESSLLGSRGFTSDQNDKFLFLVDGIAIQNIMQDGSYNFIDIPNLNMVERIEVVKGPGSTLWGSDATLGIVNIITKKGKDIAGTKVSAEYSTADQQAIGNILFGNSFTNGDFMASFSYTQSNGSAYGVGPDVGNSIYSWNETDDVLNTGFTTDNGATILVGNDAARMLDLSPSFELYTKINIEDFTVKARASYMAQTYLWNTVYGYKFTDGVMKHVYVDVERVNELADKITLSTKINAHGMVYERGVPVSFGQWIATDIETMSEMGFAAESVVNAIVADAHSIVAGLKYSRINIGQDIRTQFWPDGSDAASNTNNGFQYSINLKPAIDNTSGVFVEDNFSVTDKLKLVAGLSYEYNDLREVGGNFMPRASAIYSFADDMSVKYAFNTGYGRPPAMKKFGKYYGHATKSEKVIEHDLQFLVNNKRYRLSVTGFNYNVLDYFSWKGNTPIDPITHISVDGHYNKSVATSTGVEFDARGYIGDILSVYGNYTYANTFIDHELANGEPKHVYNIGVDYYITTDISANLNVNGFVDMYHGKDPVTGDPMFWSGLTEQIFDFSVVAKNLFDHFAVTAYVNNLTNSKVHVGMTGWPGYTYLPGTSVGLKVTSNF